MTTIEAHPLGRAALVLGVAVLLFAAALLVGDGSEDVPADASATPASPTATASPPPTSTVTPTATATPEPTATPRPGPEPAFGELPPGLEVDDAGAWVQQPLVAGEQPAADHGVLLRNVEHGGGEHWSLVDGPDAGAQFYAYGIEGDGRFVTFGDPFQGSLLTDRESGVALRLDRDEFRLLTASADGRLLVMTNEAIAGACLFWAVDLAGGVLEPLLRFGVQGNQFCSASAAFGAPGSNGLVLSMGAGSDDRPPASYAIDLEAGLIESIAAGPIESALSTTDGIVLWYDTTGSVKEPPLDLSVTRYDAASTGTTVTTFDAISAGAELRPILIAPNTRLVAWQESLRLGGGLGLGGWHEWPVVVIGDLDSGEVLVRVVRAALDTGVEHTRWLADSSGVVITIEGQYAVLRLGDPLDGSSATVVPLSFEHTEHFDPAPVPAPNDASLFAFERRFIDIDGDDVLPPLATDWARSGPLRGDWTTGGSEYYLATWDPGAGDFGDGPLAPLGLEPRLQTPPFTNEVRLVVTETTELRETASRSSGASWTFEAGTTVTVGNDASSRDCFEFGCSALIDREFEDPRPWWIFVRTDDGRAGWAESTALTWAE